MNLYDLKDWVDSIETYATDNGFNFVEIHYGEVKMKYENKTFILNQSDDSEKKRSK